MEVDKDNKPTSRWIIRNILLAIAFFAVLLVLTQMGLKAITRHNQVIIVPDLTGLSVADAKIVAKRNHIRTEVVDSVYVKRIEKGNVFSQNPAAGKEVKKDRVIKLTINAHQTKMVKMPNLVGYSLRQAKTEILSSGLSVGKLAYREDIATNNVLDQFIKGRYVAPGTEVEAETPVDLLLGLSPDENETFIPYLIPSMAFSAIYLSMLRPEKSLVSSVAMVPERPSISRVLPTVPARPCVWEPPSI